MGRTDLALQMLKLAVSSALRTKNTGLGVKLVDILQQQMQTILWVKSFDGAHFIAKSRITLGVSCLVVANVNVVIDSKC